MALQTSQFITPDRRIRVFLSSRLDELHSVRKTLVKLIRDELRLTPVYFEQTASPHPPRAAYKAYLESSEIFVGIYGEGYGWIDTDGGITISGLHDEWLLSKALPRLLFIQRNAANRESDLTTLLDTIKRNNSASFALFDDHEQLVGLIRDAIARHVSERYLLTECFSTEDLPDYAAGLRLRFAEEALVATSSHDRFSSAIEQSAAVFVTGVAGVGKTRTVLHCLANSEVIYASLRHTSLLGALNHVIAWVARRTGRPLQPGVSLDDAIRRLHNESRNEPFTLVLDDADSPSDLDPRFSGAIGGDSKLILIGCTAPTRAVGFEFISVEGFSSSEANEYVAQMAPSLSVPERVRLVEEAQGHPLYLKYLCDGPDISEPGEIEGFHAAMWNTLSSKERELIALIALSTVPMTLELLAKGLSALRDNAITAIAAQVEAEQLHSLLLSSGDGFDLFHPMFAEYVNDRLRTGKISHVVHEILSNLVDEGFKPSA